MELPIIFSQIILEKYLKKMLQSEDIPPITKSAILNQTIQVSLKWNKKPEYRFLTFNPKKVKIIDILVAFQPQYYLSHFSALYLHELTKHRPEEYFLSKEIVGNKPSHSNLKIPEKIKQAFLKSHRKTSKYLSYQKTKITLLEKQDLNRIGVKNKFLTVDKARNIKISFTSVERTLIDSIISPHYSGGIKTVINAFFKARINIDKLYEIYKAYSHFYPYWQSVGFLLDRLKSPSVSKKWLQRFSSPKMTFYLDKNFNDENWAYNSKWKIYYPKGLVDDIS